MKVFKATLVISAFLIGFGIFAYYYIDTTADRLVAGTEILERGMDSKDWKQTEKNFARLNSLWDKISPKWTILIDHEELDNINITMSRAREFMKARDTAGFTAELAELKLLLKHIPEKEALNIKNIL